MAGALRAATFAWRSAAVARLFPFLKIVDALAPEGKSSPPGRYQVKHATSVEPGEDGGLMPLRSSEEWCCIAYSLRTDRTLAPILMPEPNRQLKRDRKIKPEWHTERRCEPTSTLLLKLPSDCGYSHVIDKVAPWKGCETKQDRKSTRLNSSHWE